MDEVLKLLNDRLSKLEAEVNEWRGAYIKADGRYFEMAAKMQVMSNNAKLAAIKASNSAQVAVIAAENSVKVAKEAANNALIEAAQRAADAAGAAAESAALSAAIAAKLANEAREFSK